VGSSTFINIDGRMHWCKLQGDTLINGVVAEDATRKTAEEIEAHLETLMPAL
jgi:hypothetical protein